MSAESIAWAALERFAAQGYDATALSEIADDAGIRKPSIYAHFASKQALFLSLLGESCRREIATLRASLNSHASCREALRGYLHATPDRFAADPYLRFWVRAVYLPPSGMAGVIRVRDASFAAALEESVHEVLRRPGYGPRHPALSHDTLAAAFIGMLRGVHAELLYSGQRNSRRVAAALWALFESGLAEGG